MNLFNKKNIGKFFSGRGLLLTGLMLVVLVGVLIPTHFARAWPWDALDPAQYVEALGRAIAVGFLTTVSFITWLSGYFLNFVLKFTIVDMKVHISGLTGINTAWKVIRDLMNIAFIFLLVYEGIKMIIGLSDTAKIKKIITGFVMAALLINFSLFFTKVLIDASNIVTIGLYNSIITPPSGFVGPLPDSYGLSDPIMNALGLQGLYGTGGNPDFANGKGFGGIIIFMIGSTIILIVAAFVFFAVAIMFIVRYVVLIILLMLSPIAYMGLALPFMKTYADQWWNALKSQLLFAPIYMLMTWVILVLMSNGFLAQKSFSEIFSSGATSPPFTSMGLLLNFAVIIGLLIASLVIAKSTSTKGSSLIGKATGNLTAFAGGAVMGGAARLGRSTVGRAGNNWSNDEEVKRKAAEGNVVARMQLAAGSRMAKSTFDARSTGKFQDLSKTTGVDFGKVDSKKENFKAIKETEAKAAEEKAKQYKPSDLAVQQAKARLDTNTDEGMKLADEETEKKRAHDIYTQSDDYKNSAEYKKERQSEDDNRRDAFKIRDQQREVTDSQRKADELRRKSDDYADNTPQKVQIQQQLEEVKRETARKQDLLRDLQAIVKDREEYLKKAELDRKLWMSEEKKLLVATSGGQKEKKDGQGNITQQEIKSAFEQRTETVASRIENTGPMWRYAANTIGTVANVVGVPYVSIPKTKADRQELARRVRKATNPKTAAQLRKEADKKDKEEAVARGDKPDEDEDNEPKATPATTTPATDTTTPNTT